ncbi:unnamed protein product [Rhodiola kirilowii]
MEPTFESEAAKKFPVPEIDDVCSGGDRGSCGGGGAGDGDGAVAGWREDGGGTGGSNLPLAPDGRSTLTKALSVALILADLQMDAEVISACILLELLEAGAISMYEVKDRISTAIAHLLHEGMRVKKIPFKGEVLDDESASALRKFCLTYYEVRALILDLAVKLDTMRNLNYLPRFQQQIFSLEVMKIYAPLAHAVGANMLSLELEDLSFRYLFPYSYFYVDNWLRNHESGSRPLIDVYKQQLLRALQADTVLAEMVEDVQIMGRYKSRYSTMKKLVRDGRKPEEVNDILGLRIILTPRLRDGLGAVGENACYRTHQVIQLLWNEIPNRTKDYIARPKPNGYRSLHMAVDVSEEERPQPPMEIQIRTAEMDMLASGGTASHSLYKSGLTDPEEARKLKAIMMAAAEVAALRLQENGDGKISIEELTEVMVELGASGEDAREMMQLLDSNSDGSLSSDEFDTFQKQVNFMRNLEDRDVQYKTILDEDVGSETHTDSGDGECERSTDFDNSSSWREQALSSKEAEAIGESIVAEDVVRVLLEGLDRVKKEERCAGTRLEVLNVSSDGSLGVQEVPASTEANIAKAVGQSLIHVLASQQESKLQQTDRLRGKKVEICMGSKCRKSGGWQLLEQIHKLLAEKEDVEVVGCKKCMGKCKNGPNLRLSATNAAPAICFGVDISEVHALVASFLDLK